MFIIWPIHEYNFYPYFITWLRGLEAYIENCRKEGLEFESWWKQNLFSQISQKNNELSKGCILMGKIFFQVFKLHDKNSSNKMDIGVGWSLKFSSWYGSESNAKNSRCKVRPMKE